MILNIPVFNSLMLSTKIASDLFLLDQGVDVCAVDILGESGIGKSEISKHASILYGITKENIHVKNLAELGDPAEFLGYPGEYVKVKFSDGTIKSIQTKLLPIIPKEEIEKVLYETISASYAAPDWVVEMWEAYDQEIELTDEELAEGRKRSKTRQSVLILDDLTRGNSHILAAVAELINQGKYGTWKLPPNTYIVCTSNPDNGVYNVQSTDKMFNSRKAHILLKFDLKNWLEWADTQECIDSRIINWLAVNPEILTEETITLGAKSEDTAIINARSIVKAAKKTKHLNFDTQSNLIELELGSLIGTDKASMFSLFLKTFGAIPTMQEVYENSTNEGGFKLLQDTIHSKIVSGKKVIDLTKKNPMLEHIIVNRTLNYINELEKVDAEIVNRIKHVMTYEDPITKKRGVFSTDHSYHLVKQINKGRSKVAQRLAKDPQILRLLSEANKKTN
jgi:hypothetical protein